MQSHLQVIEKKTSTKLLEWLLAVLWVQKADVLREEKREHLFKNML